MTQRLNWGGAFVLFEKVRGPDARFQDILSQLYNEFKLRNGFSSEEIVEKTRSLKGVLEPFSTQGKSASCWALLKRWTSSIKRIVRWSLASRRIWASAMEARMSFTPESTAFNAIK